MEIDFINEEHDRKFSYASTIMLQNYATLYMILIHEFCFSQLISITIFNCVYDIYATRMSQFNTYSSRSQ